MLYTIPDYYRQFGCSADACEDTCCAGWKIVIDRKSLARYGKVRGRSGRRLAHSIHWPEGTFRQSADKRCAFLNEKNLCDLYTELGEKSLCRTCRLYPRHIEEFEGVREITLSVSCPEAARLLLGREEPIKYLTYEKEGEEEYPDFDPFLYSKLVDGREVMRRILQDRRLDIKVRAGLVLGMAHDMQVRIGKEQLFACEEVFEKYQKESAVRFVRMKIADSRKQTEECYTFARRMFRNLYALELLRNDWEGCLHETEYLLFERGAGTYEAIHLEFGQWLKEQMPLWEVQCEQLLVYFIYTYFCGAVYDGRAYAKIQMSVVSVFLIGEILTARWLKNEKQLCLEDVVEIVYRYSRELEHSDENLEQMEQMMERDPFLWFTRKGK